MAGELMRAAVLVDTNRLELRDVPRANPRSHEVVVRVTAVGLCGTDLHIVAGAANYNCDDSGRARPLCEEPQRSEERRVGKECRSRWSPYH